MAGGRTGLYDLRCHAPGSPKMHTQEGQQNHITRNRPIHALQQDHGTGLPPSGARVGGARHVFVLLQVFTLFELGLKDHRARVHLLVSIRAASGTDVMSGMYRVSCFMAPGHGYSKLLVDPLSAGLHSRAGLTAKISQLPSIIRLGVQSSVPCQHEIRAKLGGHCILCSPQGLSNACQKGYISRGAAVDGHERMYNSACTQHSTTNIHPSHSIEVCVCTNMPYIQMCVYMCICACKYANKCWTPPTR